MFYVNPQDCKVLKKIQDHFLKKPRQDQDLNLQDQDKTKTSTFKTSTFKTKTKTKTLSGKTKTRPRPQKFGLETVSRQDRSRDLTSLKQSHVTQHGGLKPVLPLYGNFFLINRLE